MTWKRFPYYLHRSPVNSHHKAPVSKVSMFSPRLPCTCYFKDFFRCGALSLWQNEPVNNKETNGWRTSQLLLSIICLMVASRYACCPMHYTLVGVKSTWSSTIWDQGMCNNQDDVDLSAYMRSFHFIAKTVTIHLCISLRRQGNICSDIYSITSIDGKIFNWNSDNI